MSPRASVGVNADASAEDDTKYARTRGRILDAAAYVLSRKGYAGTRLSDVAQRADIQTPAIYYYFASREELIEEVMPAVSPTCARTCRPLPGTASGTSPIDKILVAVEAHLRHELELSDYASASIRNPGQIPDHCGPRRPTRRRLRAAVATTVRRSHPHGTAALRRRCTACSAAGDRRLQLVRGVVGPAPQCGGHHRGRCPAACSGRARSPCQDGPATLARPGWHRDRSPGPQGSAVFILC